VGVSVVNALSSALKVIVHRNGKIFEQEYAKGKPLYDVRVIGDTTRTGTETTFMLILRFSSPANMTMPSSPHASVNWPILIKDHPDNTDEREKDEKGKMAGGTFFSKDGLRDFIDYLDVNREKLIPEPIAMEGERGGMPIEIAMQYNTSFAENIHSYVNNINTHEAAPILRLPQGSYPYPQVLCR